MRRLATLLVPLSALALALGEALAAPAGRRMVRATAGALLVSLASAWVLAGRRSVSA